MTPHNFIHVFVCLFGFSLPSCIQLHVHVYCSQEEQHHLDEMKAMETKLSEANRTYIQQSDKLREVRRIKIELDHENTDLKRALKKAEVFIYSQAGACLQ